MTWRHKIFSEGKTVYVAPWEKAFNRVLTPLEEFIHRQSTSSILLMLSGMVALIVVNSPWASFYGDLLHQSLGFTWGNHQVSLSSLHVINEGLMAFFFLMVGLELKRELLVGELADIRHALLPILAAIGGMVVPALLYLWWNPVGIAANGWGIPMATDIAFAVGAASLLAHRIPKSLVIFLIALAIVDDLGAVAVIAVFYTDNLSLQALGWCVVLVGLLFTLNLAGIQHLLPYLLVGFLLWCAMLSSGIHATLAGVVLAFCIPLRPKYSKAYFVEKMNILSERLKNNFQQDEAFHSTLSSLDEGLGLVQAPAQRLERALHFPVAYLVIPLFALANAGITIESGSLSDQLVNPVALGVICGLIVGKLLGIFGATWLAVKSGIAALPQDLYLHHVVGIGLLGGVGFTMSIFIADLAFEQYPAELLMAKTGILLSSLVAGGAGILWLWMCSMENDTQVKRRA